MNRFERTITAALGAAIAAAAIALAGSQAGAQLTLTEPARSPAEISDPTGELATAGLVDRGQDGTLYVDADAVLFLLEQLEIDDRGTVLEYDRDLFGTAWADVDHNGCDTRNDVLRRDLVDVELKPGTNDCVVLAGTLHDPYTGATIDFLRGQGTSALVALDHRIALAFAWHHGAAEWSPEQRLAFANDPTNLIAVDGSANTSKSSRGPGEWLPPNIAHRCAFAVGYTFVAAKYSISLGAADVDSIAALLEGCPSPAAPATREG